MQVLTPMFLDNYLDVTIFTLGAGKVYFTSVVRGKKMRFLFIVSFLLVLLARWWSKLLNFRRGACYEY